MGILNLGGGSGLLGLGGIGGVSSTGALGTMGGLLDPQEMKKQQIKNAMLQAGISLMTNGGIGEAAGAGLLGERAWPDLAAETAQSRGECAICVGPDANAANLLAFVGDGKMMTPGLTDILNCIHRCSLRLAID